MPETVVQMRFSGGMGGAESVAFSLARILSGSLKNSVVYLVLEERGGKDACEGVLEKLKGFGVRFRVFRTGSRFSLKLFRELKSALREDRAELVHAHCYKSAFYSMMLKRLGGAGLKKVVFTLHGLFDPLSMRSALIHAVNAADVLWADRIIGCSKEISTRYGRLPVVKGKVDLIQNCLFADNRHDLGRIAGQRDWMRKKMCSLWGLDDSAVWVANIGRLTEQKDLPLYFRAAKEALSSGTLKGPVQFLVVGDGKLRGALERLAEEMGISSRVFFTSFVSDMDMLLTGIDILMVTSLWEGTPMCVLEAMGYGKPVISTDAGGLPDVVIDGRTGFLVKGSDYRGLARAAVELVNDRNKRERMGMDAHGFVTTELSQARWMERHLDLYRSVMAG